jgi:hypothetical protein
MDRREPDVSGDYGYDLAHEDRAHEPAVAAKGPHERPGEHPGPAPAARQVEFDQDMSYDEAHDF